MQPVVRLYVILPLIVAAILPQQRAGSALLLPRYSVTDVGTFGGAESDARGINSRGDVVGSAETGAVNEYSFPVRHAFFWQQGTLRDLGLLSGESAEANAINDLEQVVGTEGIAFDPELDLSGQAFIWDLQGGMRYLPDLSTANCPGSSAALGINNHGEAVGWWGSCYDGGAAVYWKRQHGPHFFPRPPGGIGFDMAFAVNDRGEVAETCGFDFTRSIGGLWKPGARGLLLRVPGVRPFANGEVLYSYAAGINQRGWVVGSAYRRAPDGSALRQASVWTPSAFQYLPIIPPFNQSWATAINNGGTAVGVLEARKNYEPPTLERACLWIDGQAVTDFNDRIPPDSGWVLQEATGINDAGQIVGTGLHNGVRRGFVLTPL